MTAESTRAGNITGVAVAWSGVIIGGLYFLSRAQNWENGTFWLPFLWMLMAACGIISCITLEGRWRVAAIVGTLVSIAGCGVVFGMYMPKM